MLSRCYAPILGAHWGTLINVFIAYNLIIYSIFIFINHWFIICLLLAFVDLLLIMYLLLTDTARWIYYFTLLGLTSVVWCIRTPGLPSKMLVTVCWCWLWVGKLAEVLMWAFVLYWLYRGSNSFVANVILDFLSSSRTFWVAGIYSLVGSAYLCCLREGVLMQQFFQLSHLIYIYVVRVTYSQRL